MMNVQTLGGNVEVVQIVEFEGPTHDAQYMLPEATARLLEENASWLRNRFWTPATNRLVFSYQLWLVRSGSTIVLIDTGCGNHKRRSSRYQNMINTPALDWLKSVGAAPEAVTHVLHTHLHADHVGWNTQFLGGRWVPTFPNATYYMPRLDYELFAQRRALRMKPPMYDEVMVDSVLPVLDAGLVRFIEDGDEVAGLVCHGAPGHTPGHVIYTLRHGGEEIVFSGDVFHSPLQVLYPHINSRWCEDEGAARATRLRVLRQAAEGNARILPAHIRGVEGWRVARTRAGFSLGFDRATLMAGSTSGNESGESYDL